MMRGALSISFLVMIWFLSFCVRVCLDDIFEFDLIR